MVKRFALIGVLVGALLGAIQPSFAAGVYHKNYVGSTDGYEILTTNPARDYGNPADNANVAAQVENAVGYPGPADSTQATAYATLNGTPANSDPLTGTPADKKVLSGTPADQEMAGAIFTSYSGVPSALKVNDTVGAAAGLPVRWVALQCKVGSDSPRVPHPCPGSDVVEQFGCSLANETVTLKGFVAGHWFVVFIVNNDTVGLWGPGGIGATECDSTASTGTITLTTV